MLCIGKPAEFGPDNYPIRGQCQPHTKGWKLRIFHRGCEEVLYEDTYYLCTQIQRQCRGFSDDEARVLVKKIVANLVDSLNLQKTQPISAGEQDTEINRPVTGPRRSDMATEVFSRQEIEESENKKRRKRFEE